MSAYRQFDRIESRMPELLTELGAPSMPDYVDDLLARTAATRQRPRWTFIERWFPMGVIARDRILLAPIPWRAVSLAAALLLLLTAALVIVGSQRRVPPPFGPAANGSLANDRNGDIFIRNALTDQLRPVVTGPETDFAPGFSRDGTKLSFLRVVEDRPGSSNDTLALMLGNADGSNIRQLTGGLDNPDWADWSPDGSQIVFEQKVDLVAGIHLLDVATGDIRPLDTGRPSYVPTWRPPDGREIVYRGWVRDGSITTVALFSIRPDGTGERQLTPPEDNLSAFDSLAISPDGRYLTYHAFDQAGLLRIHKLEIDTGLITPLRLGPAGGHELYGSFSPDGSLLLFHWTDGIGPVQVMVAPVDGSRPAIPIGPEAPVVGESATLQQAFSPDGKYILLNIGRLRETRLIEVAKGGMGELLPWDADGVPSWQRKAADR